jgi:RNA polymerase sigma-70 factor (ECF subfamily)
LLERARTGDQSAIEQLFQRAVPALRRWASGRLPVQARDLVETQDLVQDTLLRTFQRLETFECRGEGALQAYLRQALLNRIRDEVRRARRRAPHDDLDHALADRGPSPLEIVIGVSAVERYEKALLMLQPVDREAIVMRLELRCSFEELAVALNKPSVGAARKTLERALVRLAQAMAGD